MSDIPADINIREQLARIDNLREEALKFAAEQHKLAAEQSKLAAEADKLRRDLWLAPLLVIVSAIGAAGGVLSVLHAVGVF